MEGVPCPPAAGGCPKTNGFAPAGGDAPKTGRGSWDCAALGGDSGSSPMLSSMVLGLPSDASDVLRASPNTGPACPNAGASPLLAGWEAVNVNALL